MELMKCSLLLSRVLHLKQKESVKADEGTVGQSLPAGIGLYSSALFIVMIKSLSAADFYILCIKYVKHKQIKIDINSSVICLFKEMTGLRPLLFFSVF